MNALLIYPIANKSNISDPDPDQEVENQKTNVSKTLVLIFAYGGR